MEGDLGPEEVRERTFEIVRRGYDRAQVDRFKDEVSVALAAVKTELAELREQMSDAGIAELADMKAELDAVSADVADILKSAREAAEGMRTRASEDAARWRAEADQEVRTLRSTAAKQAEAARASAWEAGTQAIKKADEEAQRVLEQARQDALFIRAEAEREALRQTGDARRDGEEIIRSARSQSERLLLDARAESDRILESARQSAQNAQERARALEQRRSELMTELEAARLSIGQLEKEIDTRREALQAAADAPDSGVRVIKSGSERPTEWFDEDATVRIVSPARVPVDEPVDPEAFIAEVEQLKTAPPVPEAPTPAADDDGEAPAPDVVARDGADSVEGEGDGPDGQIEVPPAEPAAHDSGQGEAPEVPVVPIPDPLESEPGPVDEHEVPVGSGPTVEVTLQPKAPQAAPDGLADLFAQLRTASVPKPDTPAPDAPVDSLSRPREPGRVIPAPTPATASAPVAVLEGAGEAADRISEAADLAADPFELRDRLLLPIENRTLRAVKRRIVDLQNRVLEELRIGGDEWEADRSMFMASVSEDISRFNTESHVAGHAAAAELMGAVATSPPDRPATQETVGDFVAGLTQAVEDAVKRTRASGGGARQITAAVGRVFRAWRTDEAERRLRRAGYGAFNAGLIGGFLGLGVERIVAVSPGNPCGECPAGTGRSWPPGGSPPVGTRLPPATPECRAVVVPAR